MPAQRRQTRPPPGQECPRREERQEPRRVDPGMNGAGGLNGSPRPARCAPPPSRLGRRRRQLAARDPTGDEQAEDDAQDHDRGDAPRVSQPPRRAAEVALGRWRPAANRCLRHGHRGADGGPAGIDIGPSMAPPRRPGLDSCRVGRSGPGPVTAACHGVIAMRMRALVDPAILPRTPRAGSGWLVARSAATCATGATPSRSSPRSSLRVQTDATSTPQVATSASSGPATSASALRPWCAWGRRPGGRQP